MRYLSILALVLLAAAITGDAQPRGFCAVTVSVRNPDGLPLQVPVELVGPSGQTEQRTTSIRGTARICDLGFGLHSIVVAKGECGSTTLNDVSLAFGRTHHFEVILNPCPTQDMQRTGCAIYFRVRVAGGDGIGGVLVRSDGYSATTDEYGRAELPITIGKATKFRFTSSGFKPKEMDAECKAPIELNQEIVLESK